MIRSLIVDDEEKSRETLKKMVQNFCQDVEVVGEAASVAEAVDIIDEENPDVVFLDVEMPGGNGFTLLEKYDKPPFQVIFTTAHDLYAINAIKFAALDYLLKPVNIKELQEAVSKVEKSEEDDEIRIEQYEALKSNLSQTDKKFTKIALPTSEGIDFFEADDIIRAEADRAYSNFFIKGGKKIMISKPLKEYEALLEECNFFRIHKSHMVNLNHLKKYVKGKGGYVIMDDESYVDVSVRRKEALLTRIGYH